MPSPFPVPTFPLPLQAEDQEPTVSLQALLNTVYERSGYDYFIDYRTDPLPPLSEDDRAWIDRVLREQDMR
ncbi:MAG: DUF4058 family protein [Cyanobacteria bacterium J06638_22]